jgi:hypothetical protein
VILVIVEQAGGLAAEESTSRQSNDEETSAGDRNLAATGLLPGDRVMLRAYLV